MKKGGWLFFLSFYRALLPILITPLVIAQIGIEAYGVVAASVFMIGVAMMLDAGISASLIRHVSLSRERGYGDGVIYHVINTFLVLLIVIFFLLSFFYNWLTVSFFKFDQKYAVSVLLVIWISFAFLVKGVFASLLIGFERQVFVSGVQSFSVTTGFFILFVFSIYRIELVYYFLVILIVYVMESVLYIRSLFALLTGLFSYSIYSLSSVVRFFYAALGVSFLTITWAGLMQLDRISITMGWGAVEMATYQIAIQLAGVFSILIGPVTGLLLPSLTTKFLSRDQVGYGVSISFYFSMFSFVGFSIVIFYLFSGRELTALWLRDSALSVGVYNFAKWLIPGYFLFALLHFVFLHRFAVGRMKSHIKAFILYAPVYAVSVFCSGFFFGGEVLSKTIFFMALMYLLFWGGWTLFSFSEWFYFRPFLWALVATLVFSIILFIINRAGVFDFDWLGVFLRYIISFLFSVLFVGWCFFYEIRNCLRSV